MNHIDTLKQALETLEDFLRDGYDTHSCWLAVGSLRLAIEQAERQEPVSFGEAEEQALKVHDHLAKALRIPTIPWPDPYAHGHEAAARAIHASYCEMRFAVMDAIGALTALRAALAAACAPPQRQPDTDPVGVMMVRVQPDGTKVCKPEFYEGKTPQAHELLYTAPPQRQPLIPEALQVIDDLYDWRTTEGRMKAYRAIERAHGIGGDK